MMSPLPNPALLAVTSQVAIDAISQAPGWLKSAATLFAGGLSAVLGGFAGSFLSEQYASDRRQRDQLQHDKSAAFRLQLDLMGIYSDAMACREALGQSRVKYRGSALRYRALAHQGFSGVLQHTRFRTDDLEALSRYGTPGLLNLVADLDRRANVVADAFNIYRETWRSLEGQLEGRVVGDVVQLRFSEADLSRFEPRFAAQSKLLEDIEPIVEALVLDTFAALVGIYQARVVNHGLPSSFEGLSPSNEDVLILADPSAPIPDFGRGGGTSGVDR